MAGDDAEQLLQDMDQKDAATKKRKSLGIPEVDPDALPSAQVTTYLTFSCKRMMYR